MSCHLPWRRDFTYYLEYSAILAYFSLLPMPDSRKRTLLKQLIISLNGDLFRLMAIVNHRRDDYNTIKLLGADADI